MKLKFLVDYRGILTREWYYEAGDVVEVSGDIQGQALVNAGRAEFVEEEVEPTPDAELAMQHDPPSKKPGAKPRGRPRKRPAKK